MWLGDRVDRGELTEWRIAIRERTPSAGTEIDR
jgi:hypothetical protein